MTYATDDKTKKSVQTFQQFDVDTQLGLLWFGYKDIKDQLQPANETSAQDTAEALFNQIQSLSKEEQLQAQRDIASRANNDISGAYSSLSSSGKLDLWLRLAQGMDKGTVIQVPSDYELPAETKDFADMIKQLDFEQRIDFMRSAVVEMGAK
ncbi:orange carotenoid protein N-terminal domain-containing protein [Gloeocapsopsis dulcis]|uniref:Orange carotenoid protein n=1 Tax=Gloeocapsopsis dulcis AAB1 = 1H9 TaxID=1433147 RepID=A0A6N8FRU2_9CHRO|nr:orange carotenoid protein N-terminal domain-containing protein [Gloeocapsopsis dulcis]MUL35681.1 Orange carotenoid protein [Gloeocapsopsis dulcis AAB1 = 1H9]WNN91037.1 orange carotenoid protein N-terminal domain-containing protein [Gloeocapsopsis dulcis]